MHDAHCSGRTKKKNVFPLFDKACVKELELNERRKKNKAL